MKAVIIEEFGGVDKLKITNVETPKISENEVLIEIHGASVNPVDWKIREGYLKDFLPHKFPLILGWDASGIIKEIGKNVCNFKIGDKVYAYARKPEVQWGTYAEFIALPVTSIAHMPCNLDFMQAASVPLVALTAWQSLFDKAHIQKGEKVLIHAGAGGVGGFAIQFASNTGCKVITTAKSQNHSYVKMLGAEIAIDYEKENFNEIVKNKFPEGLDVVFDCVGGKTLENNYNLLKKGGRIVSIVEAPNPAQIETYKLNGYYVFVEPNGKQLEEIKVLFEHNKLKLLAIEQLPIHEIALAHKKSIERHTQGKIVLNVKDHF